MRLSVQPVLILAGHIAMAWVLSSLHHYTFSFIMVELSAFLVSVSLIPSTLSGTVCAIQCLMNE